ncbi:MAG: 2-oxo acid dehydrogenase subunit E2 [Rhodocyclaceae bacterium]|nr:2-oxo acid dehydrogenase subunit E2 [Rhodocyclaceae bacterium]
MIEFKLPSLGADMDQGTLLEWKVSPGDTVKKGQVVAVVDTSKAAVDVEIWVDGVVRELLVHPGETVPVGAVLATLDGAAEKTPAAPAPDRKPALPTREAAGAATPHRVSPAARKHAEERGIDIERVAGSGPEGGVTVEDIERAATPTGPAPAASGGVQAEAAGPRRPVTPAARRRARELGVDIESVTASGPGGAVLLEDVEHTATPAAPAKDRHGEMRRAIAAAMSRSKREIPHYYLSETVPMRHAQAWLAQANAGKPVTERLLMAVIQLKAVALALNKFPEMNGFFRDNAFEASAAAHLGVAISLRQGGLIAPAIHDVGDKPLEQLMRDLTDLVKRARAGSLRSSEMSDPTITVTNLGEQGVAAVYGVIYPPQVALVGFGRIVEQPWVDKGEMTVMPAVTASLAADHRVSDGHRGALFLAELRELLQQPEDLQ